MTDAQPTQAEPRAPADTIRPNGPFVEDVTRRTRRAAAALGHGANTTREYSTRQIRTHPLTAAALALGVGAALGALGSAFARGWQSPRTRARARNAPGDQP